MVEKGLFYIYLASGVHKIQGLQDSTQTMNKDSSEIDYRPFRSQYPAPPDPSCEAELSEGATQPPTDRPPPDPPDLTNETNASSGDPWRSRHQPDGSADNEEDDENPFASFFADDSDVNESPGQMVGVHGVPEYESESVWMILTRQLSTHPLRPSNQLLTIGMEDIMHQRLVLYGFKVNNISIAIKADLNDGHPISEAILFLHAEKYTNSQTLSLLPHNIQRHKEEGVGIYFRGDFFESCRECTHSGPRPVVASKNTTPFGMLLSPRIDEAISDLEHVWKRYYGKSDLIWHRRWNEEKPSGISEVNITAPLLLAVLHRSSFISIRYDHYTTLQHLDAIPCHECAPHSKYVLCAMACLTKLHQDICNTLERVKRKTRDVFERTMNDMYTDTSKYLVYHCDEKDELPYKYIELPHFVIIKLHRGGKTVSLAMFYQQVPPYYFGFPVSLQKQGVTSTIEYQELISSSREYEEISRYFVIIIEKVNQKLEKERETFFMHHSDLRGNDHLLQIYPYRFRIDQNNIIMPDCSCRHLAITIHEKVA